MKKDSTLICFLLDRSGSMASIRNDVIGGFNSFVDVQKNLPGIANVTLVQFDDEYEIVFKNREIKSVPPLNEITFYPRGNTALLDALGRLINETGKELDALSESEKPERIIIVTQTDGLENSSKEFDYNKISEMIKHQELKYNWQFVYIGANQNAIKEASKFGIKLNKSITYAANSIGASNAYDSMNNLVSNMRCATVADMNNISFSDEDRKKQEDLLNKKP